MTATYGPSELRVRWIADDEPYDPGDYDPADEAAIWAYVETHGVYGCVVETRAPACACCGLTEWQHAASLWSIVGDDAYHREVEADLVAEAS